MSVLHGILLAYEGDGDRLTFLEIFVVWTDGLEKMVIYIVHLRVLVC